MGLSRDPQIVELTDEGLAESLRTLEQKHGMTTDQFLERFNAGELSHENDFITWAGLAAVARAVSEYAKSVYA